MVIIFMSRLSRPRNNRLDVYIVCGPPKDGTDSLLRGFRPNPFATMGLYRDLPSRVPANSKAACAILVATSCVTSMVSATIALCL